MRSVNNKLKLFIRRFRKSFTLVELSIVLMVMSILTATTLVGRNLVYQAYAKTIIQHQQEYHQAITDFYMTYHALPGDFNDAQYQLAKSGYTTKTMNEISSLTTVEQFKIPLNGNGNGKVDLDILTTDGVNYSEAFGVWSHLSAIESIKGDYSNLCYENNKDKCVKQGYNLPKVKYGNDTAAWVFYKPDTSKTNTQDYKIFGAVSAVETFKNHHVLSAMGFNYSKSPDGTSLTGVRGGGGGIRSDILNNVDVKIDDSNPYTGSVIGMNTGDGSDPCNTESDNITLYDGNKRYYYNFQGRGYCIAAFIFEEF